MHAHTPPALTQEWAVWSIITWNFIQVRLSCGTELHRTHLRTRVPGQQPPSHFIKNRYNLLTGLAPGIRVYACLSDETLKAAGPFYLLPSQGSKKAYNCFNCVTCCDKLVASTSSSQPINIILITKYLFHSPTRGVARAWMHKANI